MILLTIDEIVTIGVFDRGVPNSERIIFQVNEDLNLGQYGVFLGWHAGSDPVNSAWPFRDCLFWFGDGIVTKSSWIHLYTGTGESRQLEMPDNQDPAYVLFWGRDKTLFANSNVVPMLVRVDAVQVALPPENIPQIAHK